MRLATVEVQGRQHLGAVEEEGVVLLNGVAPDMLGFIEAGATAQDKMRAAMKSGQQRLPLTEVKLLAPIPRPRKNVFALGRNYGEHAKESASATGQQVSKPIIFTKVTTSVNAPYGDLVVDPSISVEVDWEVELAVVIGKRIRKVSAAEALGAVFGYTVLNDVSARDLQNRTSQLFIGKSVDGYCPMGPWIVTADEIPDPQNLNLRCSVNGVVKQQGNTRDMIFTVAEIIRDLAAVMTLEAGDIISTGTPAGVGFARKPPEFLKPGDVLESEVERIGVLRNRVIGAG